MGAIWSAKFKFIKDGGNQRRLVVPDIASHDALTHRRQDIELAAIRVRGADLNSNMFFYVLVYSEAYSRECAVAELMYYPIPFVR
ncbi:hypothetical protein E4U10_004901 [Claviceps purpurea]|nr:hypothetical protein E4U10_004901 [Claviceps purpurea]